MLEKSSGGVRILSAVAIEMREAIIKLAGSPAWFDRRERWLERAARAAKISYRSAKSLFYCEAENPGSETVEKVRAALAEREAARRTEEAAARDEYQQLVARISRLESRLDQEDADFHRPQIDALRGSLRMARGEDRTVDQGLKHLPD